MDIEAGEKSGSFREKHQWSSTLFIAAASLFFIFISTFFAVKLFYYKDIPPDDHGKAGKAIGGGFVIGLLGLRTVYKRMKGTPSGRLIQNQPNEQIPQSNFWRKALHEFDKNSEKEVTGREVAFGFTYIVIILAVVLLLYYLGTVMI